MVVSRKKNPPCPEIILCGELVDYIDNF